MELLSIVDDNALIRRNAVSKTLSNEAIIVQILTHLPCALLYGLYNR